MSLVVVTSAQSGLTDHLTILKRFPELMSLIDTHASLGLSFHVLQVSSSGGSANAYLNVARLLAPTDRVVLFPDGLLSHLSSNLYSSVVKSTSLQPLVLGNNSRRTYPFAPMSPSFFLRITLPGVPSVSLFFDLDHSTGKTVSGNYGLKVLVISSLRRCITGQW
jgi:hypothetical protein